MDGRRNCGRWIGGGRARIAAEAGSISFRPTRGSRPSDPGGAVGSGSGAAGVVGLPGSRIPERTVGPRIVKGRLNSSPTFTLGPWGSGGGEYTNEQLDTFAIYFLHGYAVF